MPSGVRSFDHPTTALAALPSRRGPRLTASGAPSDPATTADDRLDALREQLGGPELTDELLDLALTQDQSTTTD